MGSDQLEQSSQQNARETAAEDAAPSPMTELQPSALMSSGLYAHLTCGMHPRLVACLRDAFALDRRDGGVEARRLLAQRVAERVDASVQTAVVIAPPFGPLYCVSQNVSAEGTNPRVVIWLLLDELDIDSKQTTFILHNSGTTSCDEVTSKRIERDLYKLTPEGPILCAKQAEPGLPPVAEQAE